MWARQGGQFCEAQRGVSCKGCYLCLPPLELERQMKMENLFVTWQQRSAPASMPISVSSPVCILH